MKNKAVLYINTQDYYGNLSELGKFNTGKEATEFARQYRADNPGCHRMEIYGFQVPELPGGEPETYHSMESARWYN